jgi:hypothetical protein
MCSLTSTYRSYSARLSIGIVYVNFITHVFALQPFVYGIGVGSAALPCEHRCPPPESNSWCGLNPMSSTCSPACLQALLLCPVSTDAHHLRPKGCGENASQQGRQHQVRDFEWLNYLVTPHCTLITPSGLCSIVLLCIYYLLCEICALRPAAFVAEYDYATIVYDFQVQLQCGWRRKQYSLSVQAKSVLAIFMCNIVYRCSRRAELWSIRDSGGLYLRTLIDWIYEL